MNIQRQDGPIVGRECPKGFAPLPEFPIIAARSRKTLRCQIRGNPAPSGKFGPYKIEELSS